MENETPSIGGGAAGPLAGRHEEWKTLGQPPSEKTVCHKRGGRFGNSDKTRWWLRSGQKKGVDSEYMSRTCGNYKALTSASEHLLNRIALYKVTRMSVAHHQ